MLPGMGLLLHRRWRAAGAGALHLPVQRCRRDGLRVPEGGVHAAGIAQDLRLLSLV